MGSGQLPPGLHPDDEVVRELMLTPEGRAWLQWLTHNGITVEIGGASSHYETANDTIRLASDADPTSLIHEAVHAQQDINDERVDIRDSSREEYVDAQLDDGASPEEAKAAGREAIRELFVNGDYVPSGYEDSTYADFYDDQWDDANRWGRSGP